MAIINKLLYPIFIFRLSFLLLIFIIKVIFKLYPKIILLCLTLVFTIINSAIFIKNKLSAKTSLNSEKIISTKKNTLENIKTKLEKTLKKQDSHQGILLNLSQVEEKLGNNNKTVEYLEKSKSQNPNSSYFK